MPRDLVDVAPIGSATAAPRMNVGIAACKLGRLPAQFHGITVFKTSQAAKRKQIQRDRVRQKASQAFGPVPVGQSGGNPGQMRIVHYVGEWAAKPCYRRNKDDISTWLQHRAPHAEQPLERDMELAPCGRSGPSLNSFTSAKPVLTYGLIAR